VPKATPPIEKIALVARRARGAVPDGDAGGDRARARGWAFGRADLPRQLGRARWCAATARRGACHPLSPDGSVEQGIARSDSCCARWRRSPTARSTRASSTSTSSRRRSVSVVSGETRPTVVERGVVRASATGTPEALELLFDVRFLPNPVLRARPARAHGRDRAGFEYVLKSTRGAAFFERLARLAALPATPLRQRGERPTSRSGRLYRGSASFGGGGRGPRGGDCERRPRGERRAPRRGEERMKPGIVIVTHYPARRGVPPGAAA
jgi:hypothetical protein